MVDQLLLRVAFPIAMEEAGGVSLTTHPRQRVDAMQVLRRALERRNKGEAS